MFPDKVNAEWIWPLVAFLWITGPGNGLSDLTQFAFGRKMSYLCSRQNGRAGQTALFLSLHTAFSVILSRGKVFLVSHVIFFGSHVVDFIPIPRKDRSHLRARFCGLKVKNVNVDGCSPSSPAASSEFGCRKPAVIRGKRFLCSSWWSLSLCCHVDCQMYLQRYESVYVQWIDKLQMLLPILRIFNVAVLIAFIEVGHIRALFSCFSFGWDANEGMQGTSCSLLQNYTYRIFRLSKL